MCVCVCVCVCGFGVIVGSTEPFQGAIFPAHCMYTVYSLLCPHLSATHTPSLLHRTSPAVSFLCHSIHMPIHYTHSHTHSLTCHSAHSHTHSLTHHSADIHIHTYTHTHIHTYTHSHRRSLRLSASCARMLP